MVSTSPCRIDQGSTAPAQTSSTAVPVGNSSNLQVSAAAVPNPSTMKARSQYKNAFITSSICVILVRTCQSKIPFRVSLGWYACPQGMQHAKQTSNRVSQTFCIASVHIDLRPGMSDPRQSTCAVWSPRSQPQSSGRVDSTAVGANECVCFLFCRSNSGAVKWTISSCASSSDLGIQNHWTGMTRDEVAFPFPNHSRAPASYRGSSYD